MNITALARKLKISTQELKDILPQLGFDIGQRAIKIDDRQADRIIKQWPKLKQKIREQEQQKRIIEREEKTKIRKISIPEFITVRDFADASGLLVNRVLKELMKNGIFISLNERIDFETASIIGQDLGIDVSLRKELEFAKEEKNEEKLKNIINSQSKNNLKPRPPVIVVMGHVDHGKTKLLDTIRKTNIIAEEAGGITQHIGAYQVIIAPKGKQLSQEEQEEIFQNPQNNYNKGNIITFIDTPGHEAFTAMRSRGAKIADIAILVIAADDGIKPQTIEAYKIIEQAKIPFIIAINKIDKKGANIEKVKQELSNKLNILPEDWGGKTTCIPISALKGEHIDELLDVIILTCQIEQDKILASDNGKTIGTIIESKIDKREGVLVTALIQNGTLRLGNNLIINNQLYGKVRAMKNFLGKNIKQAVPSMPVLILGFKIAPSVGDILETGNSKIIVKKFKRHGLSEKKKFKIEKKQAKEKINLVIKGDVLGSIEAIEESLEKISTSDVKIEIVKYGLGNITEGDIERAEALNAIVIGFNVKPTTQAEHLAKEKKVDILIYNIIYKLIEDMQEKIKQLTKAEIVRKKIGELKVLAIFRKEKQKMIIGGNVINGYIEKESEVEVFRNEKFITNGTVSQIQINKKIIDKVQEGGECGIEFQGSPLVEVGDKLVFYKEEEEHS